MKRLGFVVCIVFSFCCLDSTARAQDDVLALTVTSKDSKNIVEWQNPLNPPYATTRVILRKDGFATNGKDVGEGFAVEVTGSLGSHGSFEPAGLTNGAEYYYSLFVDDGFGSFSSGRHIVGRPFDASGPVKWKFEPADSAVSMMPPGIGNSVLVANNNGFLYALERGKGLEGGTWPEGWVPYQMPDPAQHRPPVIRIGGITTAKSFALLSSMDGIVRAVDADAGTELWASSDLGTLSAAPAGWFQAFGASADLVLVGTRNAGQDNAFYGLDAASGVEVWKFDDPAGTGIGIVASGATVDYVRSRVYFASHERSPGADTVWALDIATGGKVWSQPLGNVTGSTVLRAGVLYLGGDNGRIYGLDVFTGEVKANFPFDTKDGATKGFVFPDFSGDRLYASTENIVWSVRDVLPVVIERWTHEGIEGPSIPLYPSGRYLWVGSSDGNLYRIDVETGNPSHDPDSVAIALSGGGVGSASFDVANNLVYVGAEDGSIYAIGPF